jgi:hypothetical protein
MTTKRSFIKDPALAKVGVALERAAARAKQLGFDTNTPVYVYREGKIVDLVAEHRSTQLRNKNARKPSPTGAQTSRNKISTRKY